ncbi:4-(cytidine 5'-diphospho)-2-C-methyl-D-erythritol kinase [Calidifontibacter sp. DB0510]|uniref:4-diphosphocytidyl-2-C-methyl-D-erythritol kinase n=1 Tax=Metallococcus carri TaxID=1656884 RepID=A0A967B1N5_9MICO|nr:4-(cytidine 5'-diphospho)-2-C-methyl-D-erythritol kinase [Metallococcus carri]NHN55660.1 4-(cytidine 5'-diphospho)-2-C-methyl-D-erythritol kinase [Metallococcus carri]NOP38156.1 4-(cytidine 5'-diphospho)-2-C-methyl-D-erythritol kinase [Calidifontibacter sp. DB2511S]
MQAVTVRVPAKVNLALTVGPPREDGFHGLATIFHAVNLTDDVTVEPASSWSCTVTGPDAARVPTDDSNLAVKAAKRLARSFPEIGPMRITIDKSIPVAGGMAGGSADAAATLVAVDALFDLGISRKRLLGYAARLGSDVPFALVGGTALGSGRGEELAPVLGGGSYEWVFALQREGLSTPQVYAECDRLRADRAVPVPMVSEEMMTALRGGDVHALAEHLHNDLQDAAIALRPTLRDTLETGLEEGALAAVVSGSGPTCAFLCENRSGALDLMVALNAAKVADDIVRASGPHPGAKVTSHG